MEIDDRRPVSDDTIPVSKAPCGVIFNIVGHLYESIWIATAFPDGYKEGENNPIPVVSLNDGYCRLLHRDTNVKVINDYTFRLG